MIVKTSFQRIYSQQTCTISVRKCDVMSWCVLPAHTEREHYVPFLNPFPLIIIITRKSLKWSVERSPVPALMIGKLNPLSQQAHKQPLTAKSDQIRNLMIHEEVQDSNLRLTTNMTRLSLPALYPSSSFSPFSHSCLPAEFITSLCQTRFRPSP